MGKVKCREGDGKGGEGKEKRRVRERVGKSGGEEMKRRGTGSIKVAKRKGNSGYILSQFYVPPSIYHS